MSAPTPRPARALVAVLVVDNEPPIASVVRRVLGLGHDITALEDAVDACKVIREGSRFDVILCDLLMPGMSGQQFYEALVKQAPDMAERVVFMSGATTLPDSRAFLSTVRNDVLEKPFSSARLREVVVRTAAQGQRAHH